VEDPFAEVAARRVARLAAVLDRNGAQMMRQAVADGREPAGSWEHRIAYNWKDIEPIWVRALVFEPEAVAMPTGCVGLIVTSPDILLDRLVERDLLGQVSRHDARALQVTAHAYLADQRQAASADSLRLASWLPKDLGDTLEIGCGYGVLARTFIGRTRSYAGLDLTEEQARAIIRLGGSGVVGDIHDLPFGDGSFDIVVGDNVVEHALDPERVLSEVRRVLRPGGRAFFVVPLDYLGPDYRNEAHFWKADERSIRAALAEAGLKVERYETCVLPEIGAKGSFPSCNQRTSLWEVRPSTEPPVGQERDDPLVIDWRAMLYADNPRIADVTKAVTREILALNSASDLAPLARNSPALRDFDWTNYLDLSQIRVVRTAACLERRGIRGRVLDIGAYFGNFALVLARLGYDVTALDNYAAYAPAFDLHVAAMRAAGVEVVDVADAGADFAGLPDAAYDCVLCMGVIEHVPHTPRHLLAAIDRVLRSGGLLVLDTPNLAYEYKRHQLMEGSSVFAPIQTQFETEIPFEGHHREYTPAEIRWIVERIGYRDMELEMYNYSIHGLPELSGRDLERWRAMEADPERRELIFVSARKPG
jgi:SAM-dependent methyltransferase